MTAPELPESHTDPHFRSPREYCIHPHVVNAHVDICAVKRDVRMCVHCGQEVS